MNTLEIILLIAGGLILIGSFFVPSRGSGTDSETIKMTEDEVKNIVNKQMDGVKTRIEEIVDDTIQYAVEKTERSLERVSNEKIMAVNEYSDTVLQEINKNHSEVMFLYDMLNDKHKNLTTAVSKVEKTVKEAEQTVKELTPIPVEKKASVPKPIQTQAANMKKEISKPTEESYNSDLKNKRTENSFEDSADEFDTETSDQDEFVLLSPQTASEKKVIKSKAVTKQNSTEGPNLDISFTKDNKRNGNNNERILELHNQGKSNVAIAKELGLGVGEVKLVIDLFEVM